MPSFEGFPDDFFRFYAELKVNNNRPWFNANKTRFRDSVVTPVGSFITAIAPGLKTISPSYTADPRPNGGSMFRIYRDTRFAKDKTPYKTHAACHFRHVAGRDAHAPGFYVQFDTDGIRFGGGIWRPPSKQLGMIREFIADNPAAWARLRNSAVIRQAGGIQGESLKRPPRGYSNGSRHLEDLKRKTFFVMREAPSDLALSAGLVDAALDAFRTAGKLNRFLTLALELPA